MKINEFLTSLQGRKSTGYTAIVRVSNDTQELLPLSMEPWADLHEIPVGKWIDIVVIDASSIAVDVHYHANEVIAYAEPGSNIQLFDHNGVNLLGDVGLRRKPFPDPSSFTRNPLK